MQKLNKTIPIFLLLLSACSTQKYLKNNNNLALYQEDQKFRLPASVDDRVSFQNTDEEEFQKVLHSKNFELLKLRVQLRLDAIEEVYFRGKEALNAFDENLQKSLKDKISSDQFYSQQIKSGTYSKLLALRENNISRQSQFSYFLKRFVDVVNDTNSNKREIEYAQDILEYIGEYYKMLPKTYLIAHYQIALDAKNLSYENNYWIQGLKRATGLKKEASDQAMDEYLSYKENYENPALENEIKLISKNLVTQKTYISDEINKATFQMQQSLINVLFTERIPQSQNIYPSTASNGNITGYNFPKGLWSLTYDDGPHPVYTNQIAENLSEFNIKSTFFSLSKNVLAYPKVTMNLKHLGMEIANHSHDHAQLTKLNDSQLDFQILKSSEKIEEITGEKINFFRCPYGAGTNVPRIREKIAHGKMVHVFWSVDSLDWQDRNPDSIFERVKNQIKLSKNGGGVILFHDIHPQSVIASKKVMKYLKEGAGLADNKTEVKTIGEIVEQLNK